MTACLPPDPCYNITSYNDLKDRPKINGVLLEGNKQPKELHLMEAMLAITNAQIAGIFDRVWGQV